LLGRQAFGQQGGHGFVETFLAFLRQGVDLLHQIAVELDGKRNQALFLIQPALIAAGHCRACGVAEAVWRACFIWALIFRPSFW
jgi:hypothetical protein